MSGNGENVTVRPLYDGGRSSEGYNEEGIPYPVRQHDSSAVVVETMPQTPYDEESIRVVAKIPWEKNITSF